MNRILKQIILFCLLASAAVCKAQPVWTLDVTDASLWQARPSWVSGNASRQYDHAFGEGMKFSVNELSMGMKWACYPNLTMDLQDTYYLKIVYRAENIPVWLDYAFLAGNNQESVRIELTELIDDGCLHTLIREIPEMDVLGMVALQCQVSLPGGYIELKELSVFTDVPQRKVSEELAINPQWGDTQGYEFVTFATNQTVDSWFSLSGYSDVITTPQITASGVPFKIQGEPLAVYSTSLEQTDELEISIDGAAEAVYMLLGWRFGGDEWHSIGYGNRNKITQPSQFKVEVYYTDGVIGKHLPARVESGIHCISEGLGVYYINSRSGKKIEKIKPVKNIRNGVFTVFGITKGPQCDVSSPEVSGEVIPLPSSSQQGMAISTDEIAVRYDQSGNIYSIINKDTQREWLAATCRIYTIESEENSVIGELSVDALQEGQIGFSLTLINNSSRDVVCDVKFPALASLNPGGDSSELGYCFPRRNPLINKEKTSLLSDYSGYFPFQFIDAYHPDAGGIYINANDSTNLPKQFWLDKQDNIEMGCAYVGIRIRAGESVALPQALLGAHKGSWHNAVKEYKQALSKWYKPAVPRKQWFREVFNFRQQFLHFGWPVETGAFNKQTKELSLNEMVETDIEAFGGVDYLHLFDWGYTPEHERYGDYAPWDYLGGHEKFRSEIKKLQEKGIPVGLYFQGYVASEESIVGRRFGEKWQILDINGKPLPNFGSKFKMCPAYKPWQEHLVCSVLNAYKYLDVNGYYLDSYGFAKVYKCYNPIHNHRMPSCPVSAELGVIKRLRVESNLPGSAVIYTEAVPTDVTSQYQDGSFTTAVRQARFHDSYGYLNLARFILPDFKIFEILVVDYPIGDDFEGIKLVFYNGQGLWLMGTASQWYSPEVCELITKTHGILRQYRKAFTSDNPVPLVPTLNSQVYSNYFPADNEQVWTFFNSGYEHIRSDVIEVEHSAGVAYYDVWNNRALWPQIIGDKAVISLEIEPRGVGCVVRK